MLFVFCTFKAKKIFAKNKTKLAENQKNLGFTEPMEHSPIKA